MPPATAFGPGTAVEIASNDEGFCGSWFSGTVVRRLSASPSSSRRKAAPNPAPGPRYLIRFDKLFEDEAGTKQLTEEVEQWQMRPLPPREAGRPFKQGDDVDAYHNDGWWEGVITEELGQGRFEVYFRASKESIRFKHADLRLHREWYNGAWTPPFADEPLLQEESPPTEMKVTGGTKQRFKKATLVEPQEESPMQFLQLPQGIRQEPPLETKVTEGTKQRFKKGTLVEVSSDEDGFRGAWFSAKIVNEVSMGKYLVEYQNLRNDDDTDFLVEEIDALHIRPCPPRTKASHSFKFLEEVDALYNDGWWIGVVSKVLGNSRYIVYFRDTNEELEIHGSDLRPHQEWIKGEWVIASQFLKL